MRRPPKPQTLSLALVALVTGLAAFTAAAEPLPEADTAADILKTTGVQGGMIVHLGCGDGKLTAALRVDDRYTVHGLDADPERVSQARRHIQSLGLYGPVSVQRHEGRQLPYTDNLVNLVVVQDAGSVSLDEVKRVLAPRGVAWLQRNGQWQKIVKPWPETIDEWTHFLHGPDNNAVADDSVVGPPRSLQWIAPPLWLRSHETPSGVQAPVSAAGRLFYVFDEGLIGITDERLPDRWSLVCRDAFNGKLIWKRPLGLWGWRQWSRERYEGKDWTKLRAARTDVPGENQRRLVAAGDRLYITLDYLGPLSILDAATGEIVTTVKETEGTREILVSDGIAVVHTRSVPTEEARRRGDETQDAAIVAVEARTGEVLWKREVDSVRPLAMAIDKGRIVRTNGKSLVAMELSSGEEIWRAQLAQISPRTLLTVDDVVVLQGGKNVAAFDAHDGTALWRKSGPSIGGAEGEDLFVVDGLVWRGVVGVDDARKPTKRSPNALVVGWDLRTGEEKKTVYAKDLRSPEHHHRCYRNKATARYLITSHEGAEFLDFEGEDHSQNNWLRGVCKYGMTPCNGMLYVPPDQCFCHPGSKLLGFAAVKTTDESTPDPVPDADRLERGPAFAEPIADATVPDPEDWPTFRYDAARRGATPSEVASKVAVDWTVSLQGPLTAPVAADGRLYVAGTENHTVSALDMTRGTLRWQFIADGRIDSPPTIFRDRVLFGCRDGRVYCLRAEDGQLAWRFLAAPADRRAAANEQFESIWPVHGSVLVENGVAYVTAGRSTYLDGGIRVYGLDPSSGRILHQGLLEGPRPNVDEGRREFGFYTLGANSDVLVSEGGYVYMRQKKMTPELEEVPVEVLSSKGAQDVGLHLFSTSGLLDGSWYNRTFWMYAQRWPGFQLANQAPKTGQLLVVDDEKTYAVRVFYRRNVHSPMFFPGREGYLLFADSNMTEPQIVGEEGSRPPVEWLPQSDYSRGRGDEVRPLNSEAFGLDKMVGYTRADPPVWTQWIPARIRAMVKAGDSLFVAGAPDVLDPDDPYAAFEARRGALLVTVSADDGHKRSQTPLKSPPVFDGMIAAHGRLFACLRDGSVVCLK